MPLYPFILLGALFVAILILPPLVAAYIDFLTESREEQEAALKSARRREEERG